MAFLRSVWKHNRHTKLSDEWDLYKDKEIEMEQPGSTLDGISFSVKYIGSCPISTPSSAKATAEAVKSIVTKGKYHGKKTVSVTLYINLRGISVVDTECKVHLMDISLYRISYCSADATFSHVFAFNSTDENDVMECHAFLCPKRKMAQLMSITAAQTFNTAYHLLQVTSNGGIKRSEEPVKGSSKNKERDKRPSVIQQVLAPIPMLIDLTTPIDQDQKNQWAKFED